MQNRARHLVDWKMRTLYLPAVVLLILRYRSAGKLPPNVLPGCDKSVGGSIVRNVIAGNCVVNAACFAAPGLFGLGNESRFEATLRDQGINNWDFSVSKVTPRKRKGQRGFPSRIL